jgi:hypothetical protein
MKYLENAFKFLGKFYLLLIPLFFAIAIPTIISTSGALAMSQQITEYMMSMQQDPTLAGNAAYWLGLLDVLKPFLVNITIANLVSFVLSIIVMPATYGMVNKALATGNASLSDFVPELKNNFLKYIIYGLATIALYIVIAIVIGIIVVVCAVALSAAKALGIILTVILSMAFIVGFFALMVLILLWYPAMVADNLGAFEAFKKSISVVKTYFWPTLGITLLVILGGGVAGSILGMATYIPVVGPLITSIPSVLVQFILIVFYFEVYRDKTGKNDYMMEEGPAPETPGDYL